MVALDDLEISVTLLRPQQRAETYIVPFGSHLNSLPGFVAGKRHYLIINGVRMIILQGLQRLIDPDLVIEQAS